jgi:hypothetical protein
MRRSSVHSLPLTPMLKMVFVLTIIMSNFVQFVNFALLLYLLNFSETFWTLKFWKLWTHNVNVMTKDKNINKTVSIGMFLKPVQCSNSLSNLFCVNSLVKFKA